MQGLQRRKSGVWVARLAVPHRLRGVIGRSEFVRSTGTTDIVLAKIAAGETIARWRRILLQAESMHDPHRLPQLLAGSASLLAAGSLPLVEAAGEAGIDPSVLLREAEGRRLRLLVRCSQVEGHVLSPSAVRRWSRSYFRDKAPEIWESGSDAEPLNIPSLGQMPADAVHEEVSAALAVCDADVPGFTSKLLAGQQLEVVVLQWHVPDLLFVPAATLNVGLEQLEVLAEEVEALRARLAARVSALRGSASISSAKAPSVSTPGKLRQTRLLSDVLAAYVADGLPQQVSKQDEIRRQEGAIRQLIEFMGDVRLQEVDGEFLQRYRSNHLARFLARENKVRLKYGTTSMKGSIETLEKLGVKWDLMTATERDKRMQWISRMFEWAAGQQWIAEDPALAVRALSFQTKAQRVAAANARKRRGPFSDEELGRIFGQPWYHSGRPSRPFEYWLPLLALYGGFRLGEVCQLWLSDVQMTSKGTWYIDVNASTADKELDETDVEDDLASDKSLKRRSSARRVPIHPCIIAAGFIDWCENLRAAGYRRVFPELSWEEHKRYTKAPVVWHLESFKKLGMPRDGTKVFHSFRHNFNNALERMNDVRDTVRNRLMGHQAGDDVNRNVYLQDRAPDETLKVIERLSFPINAVAQFDVTEGLASVRAALGRKFGFRRDREDLGPVGR